MEKHKVFGTFILALLLASVFAASALAGGATRVSDAIWANDRLYDTVLTPTSFLAPPEHSTDVLYNFEMSGLMGQRSISESAPGDQDYNGGRWSVKMVMFTEQGLAFFDPDSNGFVNAELTNEEDVLAAEGSGYLIINDTTTYFECPLLPRLGN